MNELKKCSFLRFFFFYLWNISDLNPLCILSFEYGKVKKWTFSGGNTPPTRGRVSLTFCIWINYLQNNLNASQFVSHQCDAKTRISRPQDMTEILSTYGRTTFLLGILVQSSSKTWLNLFWFRRQDWTRDSSVAVGVALRPGEGESQGGGARRAPARQVALGQEVDG